VAYKAQYSLHLKESKKLYLGAVFAVLRLKLSNFLDSAVNLP
jgi:hypothetical protein